MSPFCVLCGLHDESPEHIFRSCSRTADIWKLCNPNPLLLCPSESFDVWFKSFVTCQDPSPFHIPSGTLFLSFLWSIWLARNKKLFQHAPLFPFAVAHSAFNHAAEFTYMGNSRINPSTQKRSVLVCWEPPNEDWFKLNVDGVCDSNSHLIAAGGVLTNHLGNWITGFNQFLGNGDCFLAETWSVLLGLKVALDSGVVNLCLESDCLNLVKLLDDPSSDNMHHYAPMINICRSYLSRFGRCKITHVLREANQCADGLSGNALKFKCGFSLFPVCPAFVSTAFTADLFGIPTPRGIG